MAYMGLVELAAIHGIFEEVLGYLGKGCELCLSLCCKQVLALVSESLSEGQNSVECDAHPIVNYVAEQIAKAGAMTIKVLKGRLKRLHWSVRGTKPELVSRYQLAMRAISLPRPSVWYFLSSRSLASMALHDMQLVVKHYKLRRQSLMNKAASKGLIDGVVMLREDVEDPVMWTSHTASLAAAGGHLELLKWMRSRPHGQSCPWDADSCAAAARHGELEVLKWLRLPGKPEGQCDWDAETSFGAAAAGHVDVLAWQRLNIAGTGAKDSSLPLATIGAVAAVATEKGQLHVMQWLWALPLHHLWGHDMTAMCDIAARSGRLAVLQWLRSLPDKPFKWGVDTCTAAAEGGHKEVLEWLRSPEDCCPWSEQTTYAAAVNGHLSVLKHLRRSQDRCPWQEGACLSEGGMRCCVDVLTYLADDANHCPTCSSCIETLADY